MALVRRIWEWFNTPSRRYGVGILVVIGIIVGVAGTIGFNSSLAYTNSTEFCTSCHELNWAAEEWKESHHYSQRTGMRAECKDCHVPDAFFPKMWRKMVAANDVIQHFRGTIDTEEKFEERRLHLAERVWNRLERTDSRACRSCHKQEAWDPEEQSGPARRDHATMEETGDTCIDCHIGVAHEDPREEEEADFSF